MKQIYVEMFDELNEETTERVIDITNFTLITGVIPSLETQKEILLTWINERANQQHDSILTLIGWSIK